MRGQTTGGYLDTTHPLNPMDSTSMRFWRTAPILSR